MVCQAIGATIAGSSELTGDDQAITTSCYLEDIHDIIIFVYTQLHNVCVYHIYICINYILPQKRGFLDSAQLCRNFPRTTFSCQTTGFGLRPTGERFQPSKELAD